MHFTGLKFGRPVCLGVSKRTFATFSQLANGPRTDFEQDRRPNQEVVRLGNGGPTCNIEMTAVCRQCIGAELALPFTETHNQDLEPDCFHHLSLPFNLYTTICKNVLRPSHLALIRKVCILDERIFFVCY